MLVHPATLTSTNLHRGSAMAENILAFKCLYCGKEFHPKQRNYKYCSTKCQKFASHIRELESRPTKRCKRCGKEFTPSNNAKGLFCTIHCRAISSRGCAGGFKERVETDKWLRLAPLVNALQKLKACSICGEKSFRNECSDDCRKRQARIVVRNISASRKQKTLKTCKECGARFIPEYGNKRKVFCSDACLKKNVRRIGKNLRKARMRGIESESFDPFTVLKRDKWTCQLCGIKTPKRLRGTYDDRAPELDHIIPVSIGGPHSMRNTQCACRKCNLEKSNTIKGQLRLCG